MEERNVHGGEPTVSVAEMHEEETESDGDQDADTRRAHTQEKVLPKEIQSHGEPSCGNGGDNSGQHRSIFLSDGARQKGRYNPPIEHTFKDNEDQSQVSQVHEHVLPLDGQDVGDGDAVDEADDDLADEAGLDDGAGQPVGDGEEEEEGDEGEEGNDFMRTVD